MNDEPINMDAPGVMKRVARTLGEEIDSWCQFTYDDGPRKHLGASLIGHACSRHLWFVFRWAKHKKHTGRQLRLFNRGHREEDRFVEWLQGIGCTILTRDPNTGNQFRISGVGGHFGGSLDGVMQLPPRYCFPDWILAEFKTNGTGAGFNNLIADGCASAKPQHFDQQSVYGYKFGFKYSVYMNICKNDDNIHMEIVKLDLKRGAMLEEKARVIILSQTPPPRLSEQPTHFECKYCDHAGICHMNEPLDINCRSCKHAEPREGAVWHCNVHAQVIPEHIIKTGCQHWTDVRNA